MAKQMQQKRGILTNPRFSNEIVQIDKKGVITIAPQNRQQAKRPNQKK